MSKVITIAFRVVTYCVKGDNYSISCCDKGDNIKVITRVFRLIFRVVTYCVKGDNYSIPCCDILCQR